MRRNWLGIRGVALLALLAAPLMVVAQQPAQPVQAPATYQVELDTSAGPVVIEVTRDLAPLGADRFYQLVQSGYYNDVRVFRVVDGFVAQFGMSGDPATNAQWSARRFPDDPVKQTNAAGTITFATSGPNSRRTQLFINLADNSRLDQMGFAPFGRVVKGMKNVEKFHSGYGEQPNQGQIAAQGNAYLDAQFPKLTKIKSAKIVGAPANPPGKASVNP